MSVNNSFAISPNLRRRVYGYGMQQTGGDQAWEIVWQRYLVAEGTERDNLAYCLAQTNRIWLIRRYVSISRIWLIRRYVSINRIWLIRRYV